MTFFIVSSLMGGINYICTIINLRTRGMTFTRMPLTIWSFFFTAVLGLLSFPVLLSAALLLIFEKNAWSHIFEIGTGKNYSIIEIANMFKYNSIVYEDDKPGEAINTLCDFTLAKNVLNWECKFNIKDYILNYIGSYE
jgi:hypothetical protein